MTVRRALNIVYELLVEPLRKDPVVVEVFNRRLRIKFDHEMTAAERRMEDLRQHAEDSGALQGGDKMLDFVRQQGLVKA